MSETSAHGTAVPGAPGPGTAPSGWVTGWTVFAGVMMMVSGVIAVLQGITGIVADAIYVNIPRYVYRFDLTAWGWIHLILGLLVAMVGTAVLAGAAWARWAGVALASLSLVAQFLYLPYYPLWALVVIAIDIFIIWALSRPREGVAGW
jgi:hypothetical protein